MTAYAQGYPRSPSQVVLEAKEKRKQVLEAITKRRAIIYQQFQEKLQQYEREMLTKNGCV